MHPKKLGKLLPPLGDSRTIEICLEPICADIALMADTPKPFLADHHLPRKTL